MSRRTKIAEALRKLAYDIEAGHIPMPYNIEVQQFWPVTEQGHIGDDMLTELDARTAMKATPGNWSKVWSEYYLAYKKDYGGEVTYEINIPRGAVCRKIQVGTRVIPAREERIEPVYEWDCGPTENA